MGVDRYALACRGARAALGEPRSEEGERRSEEGDLSAKVENSVRCVSHGVSGMVSAEQRGAVTVAAAGGR